MSNVNRLVFAIVEFLDQQVSTNAVSGEALESLEVGLQCIQTAYGISMEDQAQVAELRTGRSLMEIFNTAVGGHQPAVAQAVPTAEGACPAMAGATAVSEADCEKAEKLKNDGNELMRKEQYAQALELYTLAISKNPSKAVYYSNRAAAHSKLDDHKKALEDCQRAVNIDPTYSKAYGRMGLAYSGLNEFQKACDAYTRAVDLEPGNASYQSNLETAQQKLRETSLGGSGPGAAPVPGGLGPTLGGMDMSQLISNPAIMNAATSFLQNPEMQQMMQSFMGQAMQPGGQQDSGANMANLLSVGQQLATQLQQTNPQLVEQVRQMRGRVNSQNPSNNNEGSDGSQDQPPPAQ